MTTAPSKNQEAPWHAVYPTPAFDTPRMSASELADLMKSKVAGVDYLVIDVRRTDFEGTFIKGALNLPAHSFYPTRSTIVTVLSRVPCVIFHCSGCSATGRGPRAAGWFAEELEKQGIPAGQVKVWILDGGIKEFGSRYGDDEELVSKV